MLLNVEQVKTVVYEDTLRLGKVFQFKHCILPYILRKLVDVLVGVCDRWRAGGPGTGPPP